MTLYFYFPFKVNKLTGQEGGGKLQMFKFLMMMAFPSLSEMMQIDFMDKEATDFMVNVIRQSMEQRKEKKERRSDFIDMVLDALRDATEHHETENTKFDKEAEIREWVLRSGTNAMSHKKFWEPISTPPKCAACILLYLKTTPIHRCHCGTKVTDLNLIIQSGNQVCHPRV
jgi:hypothetical protein